MAIFYLENGITLIAGILLSLYGFLLIKGKTSKLLSFYRWGGPLLILFAGSKLSLSKPQSSEIVLHERLINVSSLTNKALPKVLEDGWELVSTVVEGEKTINFNFQILAEAEIPNAEQIHRNIQVAILKNCQSDTNRKLLNSGATFKWTISNSSGVVLATTLINEKNCLTQDPPSK